MPPTEVLVTFIATTAIFAGVPGPAMLYIAARTVAGGRLAGLMASLGVHLGCYFHVFGTAFGLSIVFELVPLAYTIVRLIGATYMIWLGLRMMRTSIAVPVATATAPASENRLESACSSFYQSVLIELLNPKTAIFFIAFLPQFVVPHGEGWPIWLQMLVLGSLVNLICSSAELICIGLTSFAVVWLGHSGGVAKFSRVAGGSALMGLGGALILESI